MTEQQKKMAVELGTIMTTFSKKADFKPIRTTTSPIQKIQIAISGVGLLPPQEVVADGESRTFDTYLQNQKITAWYRLDPDLKTGCFGVAGLQVVWAYANGNAQLATKPRTA